MNTLYIDSRDNKRIVVRLTSQDNVFEEISAHEKSKADVILLMIEKVFNKAKLTPNKIDKLVVERGPGSFTGLRVAISISNALGFSLGKPINEHETGIIELPIYE